MKESERSRKIYERPTTGAYCVEVEGCFASSVSTNYNNAGSAGNGEYADNPFGEFESANPTGGNAVKTQSFGEWVDY